MAYSEAFRNKVRDDYTLGTYSSNEELAAAHNIQPRLIYEWMDRYHWKDYKKKTSALSEEIRSIRLADKKAALDEQYIETWSLIHDRAKDLLPLCDTKGLAELSLAIKRAQEGHNLAMGIHAVEKAIVYETARQVADVEDLTIEEIHEQVERLRRELAQEAEDEANKVSSAQTRTAQTASA